MAFLLSLFVVASTCVEGQTLIKDNPGLCIATHCFLEAAQCYFDSQCFQVLQCLQECAGKPDEAQCSFACGMTDGNEHFRALLKCMVEGGCMPEYEPDGTCLARDDQALQDVVSLEQVQGDWWVLKGQNCGQEGWRGGYDWYPCQHGRFLQVDQDEWINNTTYCNGKDSVCTSDTIVTVPKISLVAPGVVRHDYPDGEAPIVPQIEDWKFVAYPDPDWALVIWCGTNPVLEYNGAFVASRQRHLFDLPSDVEVKLREAATSFGIDFDAMCVSDNLNCAWK